MATYLTLKDMMIYGYLQMVKMVVVAFKIIMAEIIMETGLME